ncbi:MAG: caspase family protein [Deltaproteobacteria bacterium]|nr:caspase family protein [Deltaproteobacteria bacterium]
MSSRNRVLSSFRTLAAVAAAIGLLAGLTGCSASKALKQPEKKDLGVLEPGTPRGAVVGELGQPYLSETQGGQKVDYFSFTQGYTETTKIARAVGHGTASVVTFGLWEVFGGAAESYFDGTEVQLKVAYDHRDKVETVDVLKGGKVVQVASSAGAKSAPPAADSPRKRKASPATPASTSVAMAPRASKSAAAAQSVSGLDFGSYHALVIGNDNYRSMPKLRTARSDAKAVAGILEKGYGFRVRLLQDATRSEIMGQIAWLRKELGPRDNLLIFYAGHGVLDAEADEGFWLPVDAERQNEANWIANADISRQLKAMEAKHVMVVADSCFSGKLLRGVSVTVPSHGYLSRIAKKRARVALASGGLEPVEDSSGRSKRSPFASAFINALEENQSVMEGTQLFERVRQPVMLASDQTPEYANIRKAGHDGGDFLFVRPKWLASQ